MSVSMSKVMPKDLPSLSHNTHSLIHSFILPVPGTERRTEKAKQERYCSCHHSQLSWMLKSRCRTRSKIERYLISLEGPRSIPRIRIWRSQSKVVHSLYTLLLGNHLVLSEHHSRLLYERDHVSFFMVYILTEEQRRKERKTRRKKSGYDIW